MCGKIKESGLTDIILLIFATILDFPSSSESKQQPAMQETRVQSLDREDPLEKGMATHSSIRA